MNPAEENVEDLHICFVLLHQKRKRVIEKIEKAKKAANPSSSKRGKKRSKRASSAKRRREVVGEPEPEGEVYEFVSQKGSDVELCVQDVEIF